MRKLTVAVGLTVILGLAMQSSAKAANVQTCTMNYIEAYQVGSTVALLVSCVEAPGTSYWAYISGAPANCPLSTADAVKMEESLAVSLRLSGKTGTVYYNPPGSCSANILVGISF